MHAKTLHLQPSEWIAQKSALLAMITGGRARKLFPYLHLDGDDMQKETFL